MLRNPHPAHGLLPPPCGGGAGRGVIAEFAIATATPLPTRFARRPLPQVGRRSKRPRHDRQAQGHHRQLRRGFHHPRRAAASAIWCTARRARCRRCRRRARRRRCRSRPMCARTRSGCSASSPMSSANGSACCRPCRASAPRSRSSVLGTLKPGRSRLRHRDARQGRDQARARRRPEGRRAHRHRTEGQGAGLLRSRSGGDAALRRAVEDKRAPQPVADAVSALVNLGYGQPQAAAAIAAASRNAGEGAETAQLIRLGLKELAK